MSILTINHTLGLTLSTPGLVCWLNTTWFIMDKRFFVWNCQLVNVNIKVRIQPFQEPFYFLVEENFFTWCSAPTIDKLDPSQMQLPCHQLKLPGWRLCLLWIKYNCETNKQKNHFPPSFAPISTTLQSAGKLNIFTSSFQSLKMKLLPIISFQSKVS